LVITSRLQQIIPVYNSKSAGQLALVTWALNFVGAAARLFTTMVEAPEKVVNIVGLVISCVLSGIIIFEILYYGSGPSKPKQEKKPEQNNQNKPQQQHDKKQNPKKQHK